MHSKQPAIAALTTMLSNHCSIVEPQTEDTSTGMSTAQASWVGYDEGQYTGEKGRRVMRSVDGTELPLGCRDSEFLRATGLSKMPSKIPREEVAHTHNVDPA